MGNEIEKSEDTPNAVSVLETQMRFAKLLAQSDLIPDAYRGKPANVLLAIGLGQQIHLNPAQSLTEINVIKGKPTMSAQLVESLVRQAGHKLRISKDEKAQSVTVTIVRRDDPDYPFTVTRDKAWAHQMGLDARGRNGSPSNYERQLMTMLTWRAITACAREACAEALQGIDYTADEMYDSDYSQPSTRTIPRRASHRIAAAVSPEPVSEKPQPKAEPKQPEAKAEPEEQVDAEPVDDDETPRKNTKPTVEAKPASSEAVKELGHPAPKIQHGMITPRQISVINQILRSVGCTTAEKAKEFINGFTPRPIEHISDLTEAEAEETISKIKKGDVK